MFGGSGAWQVYSYSSVLQVISDYRSFSNSYMPSSEHYPIGSNFNQTDPPIHSALRSVVAAPFKRQAIQDKEPLIRNRCNQLLESVPGGGPVDFVEKIAFPLSAAIICEILGLPQVTHEQVDRWAKAVVTAGYSVGGQEQAAIAQREVSQLFAGLLEQRRKEPTKDVISLIAQGCMEGEPLPMAIQLGSLMTILLAGHETTAALLANALFQFAQIPGLWQQLRQDPDLLPNALSEVLRLEPSLVSMYRVAATDIEMDGRRIKKGEMVNAWISTACR